MRTIEELYEQFLRVEETKKKTKRQKDKKTKRQKIKLKNKLGEVIDFP